MNFIRGVQLTVLVQPPIVTTQSVPAMEHKDVLGGGICGNRLPKYLEKK